MCVEFYLILAKAGAKKSLMWKLILWSTVMLVFGYVGEAVDRDNAWLWGLFSGAAYFYATPCCPAPVSAIILFFPSFFAKSI